jgi:hypothetical protein
MNSKRLIDLFVCLLDLVGFVREEVSHKARQVQQVHKDFWSSVYFPDQHHFCIATDQGASVSPSTSQLVVVALSFFSYRQIRRG